MLHLGSAGRYLCARHLSDYKKSLSWSKGITDIVISVVALIIIAAGVVAFTAPAVQVALGRVGGYVFLSTGVALLFITLLVGLTRSPKKLLKGKFIVKKIDQQSSNPMISKKSIDNLTQTEKPPNNLKPNYSQNDLVKELISHNAKIPCGHALKRLDTIELKQAGHLLGQSLRHNECLFYIHMPQQDMAQKRTSACLLMLKLNDQAMFFFRHILLDTEAIALNTVRQQMRQFSRASQSSSYTIISTLDLLQRKNNIVRRVNHIFIQWQHQQAIWPFIRRRQETPKEETLLQSLLKENECTAYVQEFTELSVGSHAICNYHIVILFKKKMVVVSPDTPMAQISLDQVLLNELPSLRVTQGMTQSMKQQFSSLIFRSPETLLAKIK